MNSVHDSRFLRINHKQDISLNLLKIIHKLLVVISIYLLFGLLLHNVYAGADIDPYQSGHGSVWLLPDNGVYIEAMQVQTDVDYEVNGAIARAKVKQQFENSSALWAEGIYVFPLPEKAAVDHFRLLIGERIIEGQVKERVAAKKKYEQAKASGKKAGLIEQQRPNVFTTSLANIAPGEKITVEFEYQQLLDYRDDRYRLRFPMVVGPRYHPGQASRPSPIGPAAGETSVYTETDTTGRHINPTRIHVLLDAGVSLYDLNSTYHEIDINQTSETRYSISTIGKNIAADRDFELVWQPQLINSPQLAVFNEAVTNAGDLTGIYTMVSLLPPDLSHLQQRVQARDVIFVVDVSGSMAGTSIEQAKASLATAVDALTSLDRFNIIWFNDETGSLFPQANSASEKYKRDAKQFIDRLDAGGGTEMLPAMQLALSKQEAFSRFRQIVFITDGNISNETTLFDVIDEKLGNSRLFTIGIGSAPNAYFMRKAAQEGRGTFTYIGNLDEVHEKTVELFKKLETPALINIRLQVEADNSSNSGYEVFPEKIPDMYAGEPATLLIKSKNIPHSITIEGDLGNAEWQHSERLKPASQSGIRIAWAREKISSLMSMHHQADSESEREMIKEEITGTALRHHLVSRYTSMVAVDITPVNTDGMLYQERLKNNLPHGWKSPASVDGIMLAQASTSSMLNLLLASLFFVSAFFMNWIIRRGAVLSDRSGFAE